MAGNKIGGQKAAIKNKENHGEDFYVRIGAIGGRNGNTGGFAKDISCECKVFHYTHYLRNCAGKKGGKSSKRTKSV